MSNCPKCSQTIEDAFGIVQCSNCKLMLVADFDGNLKISSSESVEVSALPDAPFTVEEKAVEATPDVDGAEWSFDAPEVEPAIASANEEPPEGTSAGLSVGLQEINNFANSEESRAREGILFYQVKIAGIDSADLIASVRSCLEDSKLNINIVELIKSIKTGVLVIPKLNAVKASVIVSRLKEFPFDIQWSQMSLISAEEKNSANP